MPSIRVGPSRYFSVFASSQEKNGWSEMSGTLSLSAQVNAAKSAWSCSLGCQSMALSGGVPWPSAVGRGLLGSGGAVGRPASGRLFPVGLLVGLPLGLVDGAEALSDADPPGSAEAPPVGEAVGCEGGGVTDSAA